MKTTKDEPSEEPKSDLAQVGQPRSKSKKAVNKQAAENIGRISETAQLSKSKPTDAIVQNGISRIKSIQSKNSLKKGRNARTNSVN